MFFGAGRIVQPFGPAQEIAGVENLLPAKGEDLESRRRVGERQGERPGDSRDLLQRRLRRHGDGARRHAGQTSGHAGGQPVEPLHRVLDHKRRGQRGQQAGIANHDGVPARREQTVEPGRIRVEQDLGQAEADGPARRAQRFAEVRDDLGRVTREHVHAVRAVPRERERRLTGAQPKDDRGRRGAPRTRLPGAREARP